MAQPVYTPPSFPGSEPEAAAKTTSTGTKVGLAIVFALAFIPMAYVGRAVTKRLIGRHAGSVTAADVDTGNPYEVMRGALATDRDGLGHRVAESLQRIVIGNQPKAALEFDPTATVTDLGDAVRTVESYRGEMPVYNRGMAGVDNQQRLYFHASGSVSSSATCFTEHAACGRRDELLDRVEAALQSRFGGTGLDGLAPAGGDCEDPRKYLGRGGQPVLICRYEDGDLVLTVTRQTLADTRDTLRE